jgi:G protein beta subunit-like protein
MSVILATAGQDDKIRFWEAPSGVCSRILRYQDSQVNCLEITPDKQYLAAGGNPHIRLFEINNASNQSILTLEGHTGNVTSLGFQRNGRYLYSSSEDGTVSVVNDIILMSTHQNLCSIAQRCSCSEST